MNSTDFLTTYAVPESFTAFTTLRGPHDENPYSGFNITHYCGDTAEHVAACRQALCQALHITDNHLILPHQRHTDHVICLDPSFLESSPAEQNERLDGIDALITDVPGICIGVSTADCLPILLYSTETPLVAAIHAGWRGTVQHIVRRTLDLINEQYAVTSDRLFAILGPGISRDSFEVGDEVYDAFHSADFPMGDIAHRAPANNSDGERWHIDLAAANFLELEQAGLPLENIRVNAEDTLTATDRLFSARRLGLNSGRIFSGIMINH